MTRGIHRTGLVILVLTLGFALLSAGTPGEVRDVPIKLQTALFKKVISFDKTLQGSGGLEILVIYGASPDTEHAEIVRAFNELSIPSRSVAMAETETSLQPASVIYLSAGSGSVRDISRRHGILTISGHHALVESGEAVIGVSLVDNKPRIFINRAELQETGHELSSKLLELATLID